MEECKKTKNKTCTANDDDDNRIWSSFAQHVKVGRSSDFISDQKLNQTDDYEGACLVVMDRFFKFISVKVILNKLQFQLRLQDRIFQ